MELEQERVHWRRKPNAVERGFDYYLSLLERRLRGERVSLVQNLRRFYNEELHIDLRETQVRGLMHRDSSIFIDYVQGVLGTRFVPGVQHWEREGVNAFVVWREDFYGARNQRAVDVDDELQEWLAQRANVPRETPGRQEIVVNRIIRDSALTRLLKTLYQSRCQVCQGTFRLSTGGLYAECHHMRPLGRPHAGVDHETNMLVLCPNHHAMIDFGVLAIRPDDHVVVTCERGRPENNQPIALLRHPLQREYLEYHYTEIYGRVA